MSVKAKDAELQYGNTADYGTASTWTALARVRSIKPPKRSSKEIDTTVLASNAVEREPGLPDAGEGEAVIEYAAAQAATIAGFFNTLKAWRVEYADGSGRQFNGWINEEGEEELVNGDIIRQTVKLMITGDIDHYTGA